MLYAKKIMPYVQKELSKTTLFKYFPEIDLLFKQTHDVQYIYFYQTAIFLGALALFLIMAKIQLVWAIICCLKRKACPSKSSAQHAKVE